MRNFPIISLIKVLREELSSRRIALSLLDAKQIIEAIQKELDRHTYQRLKKEVKL